METNVAAAQDGAGGRVLLVHDRLGHPFPVGLSHELARRGRSVTHLYGADGPGPRGDLRERPGGARLRAVGEHDEQAGPRDPSGPGPASYAAAVRRACLRAAGEWRADGAGGRVTLLSANARPQVQAALLATARAQGWRYVYWLQDVYGAAPAADPRTAACESDTLRGSDHVVAVTDGFAGAAYARGVPRERVSVIPNWAAEETGGNGAAAHWEPAARFAAAGDPVLLYAGTLDDRHAPGLLADLAALCAREGLGQVVVVSQGSGRELLERRRGAEDLTRLTLLDVRPYAEVPAMLAAADVLLVTLAHDAAHVSAPSKLLACLAAGRCVLAAAPPGSESARVLTASGGGLLADPADPAAVTAAALRLLRDPALRASLGRAGHAWARDAFDVRAVADRFTAVL
ncbi:glycosyltransferase [Streptomyces sp. NPDC060194]|uniref:glycosyltransferase n=1 Tax=Streptomyces sp. NPDC060194 TaxID=3347069 RepID=UPI003659F47D